MNFICILRQYNFLASALNVFNMWLLSLFLFGFLGLAQGMQMPTATDCVTKILPCTYLLTAFTTTRYGDEYFENAKDLENICREQKPFIRCIEKVLKSCNDGHITPMEMLMIDNRMFAKELCLKNSMYKKLYLESASCINNNVEMASGRCAVASGGLGSKPGVESFCRYIEGILACKVKILKSKCGAPASELFKRLMVLNGGREYLCSAFSPTEGEPSKSFLEVHVLDNIKSLMKDLSSFYTNLTGNTKNDIPRLNERNIEIVIDSSFDKIDSRADDLKQAETSESNEVQIDYPLHEKVEAKNDERTQIESTPLHSDFETSSTEGTCSDDRQTHSESEGRLLNFIQRDSTSEINETFDVFEVLNRGMLYHTGSGKAMVLWKPLEDPLENLFCSWVDRISSGTLFKCAINFEETSTQIPEYVYIIQCNKPVKLALYSSFRDQDNKTPFEMVTLRLEFYQPHKKSVKVCGGPSEIPKFKNEELIHAEDIHRTGTGWVERDLMLKFGSSEYTSPEFFSKSDTGFSPKNILHADYELAQVAYVDKKTGKLMPVLHSDQQIKSSSHSPYRTRLGELFSDTSVEKESPIQTKVRSEYCENLTFPQKSNCLNIGSTVTSPDVQFQNEQFGQLKENLEVHQNEFIISPVGKGIDLSHLELFESGELMYKLRPKQVKEKLIRVDGKTIPKKYISPQDPLDLQQQSATDQIFETLNKRSGEHALEVDPDVSSNIKIPVYDYDLNSESAKQSFLEPDLDQQSLLEESIVYHLDNIQISTSN